MTAMNAFARDDAAWLIADTACYHHNGTILVFREKVVTDASLAMLVGNSGRAGADIEDVIERWMAGQPDQSAALANLPTLLRGLADDAADPDLSTAGQLPEGIRLSVAWWSSTLNEARSAIIASTPDLAGGAEPFVLRPIRTLFMPSLECVDPWPLHSFDPETDSAALAEYQRGVDHGDGYSRVGGQMVLYRVDAQGITSREIRRWPDRIGRPIWVPE